MSIAYEKEYCDYGSAYSLELGDMVKYWFLVRFIANYVFIMVR